MLLIMRNSIRVVLLGCVLLPPAAWAQSPCAIQASDTATNETNYSTSCVAIDQDTTANVTQQVDTFQVELKARMQGGSYLFDQTYNVAFTDPTVQAAVTQAKSLLTGAGAVSFTGPTQLSSSQSTSSATVTGPYVVTSTDPSVLITEYVGPITLSIGDHGTCQGYTPGAGPEDGPLLTGCSLSANAFTLLTGQVDFDTLIRSDVYQTQTVTTTNTTLTSQVYEIDGAPAPATPAPPPLLMALMGIAAAGLYAVSKRLRRGCAGSERAS